MRHKQIPKLLATVWLLLCTVAAVRAQSGDPFKDYQQDAKGLSTLYRGKLQKVYPFRYNGTFYLDSRAFREGELLYNGKYYSGILMNIDAYMQELVVRPQATSAGVVLHRDEVAWFRFDDRLFVNLRYLGYKKADEGFYEVLRDGREPIIRMGIKHFGTSTGALSSSEEAGLDGNYSPDVINLFSRRDRYYVLLTDGTLDKISAGGCKRRMKKPYDPSGSPFTDEAFVKKLDGEANEGNVPKTNFDPISSNFLPVGFFEDTKQKDSIAAANAAMRVTYRNKIYEIGKDGKAPKGGKATISGVVLEAETGLPLPGTVIFDDNTRSYVRTDKDGRYSITLPLGDNVLNFNCESKEDLPLKIHLYANGTLDVVMTEVITYLKGSIISANSMQQHRITAIGVEKVNIKTLVKIPSAFGEGDILKAVLTLPGVKTVGEASGGINVRGGSADQNLILFGDNTIYNPTHLFGIFSSFNPDIIEGIELYKSSIPAQYGGRISSVLSVTPKEGDAQKVKGSIGIGLLTSRLHLEGPLAKGKTSFILGARTSYSDYLLKLLPKNSAYSGGGAGFTDGNIGLTHRFDDRNSLQVTGYFATDRFSFSGDTTFRYTNFNAAANFKHKGENGGSFKLSAGYDHYNNELGAHNWETGAYDLTTIIRQAFIKSGWSTVLGRHTLSYGADVVGYALDPGIMDPYGSQSQVKSAKLDREIGIEPAAYVSDLWALGEMFSVDGGIRLSSFMAMDPGKFYMGPEFRFSTKFSPAKNLSFKAGYNTMRQYIHLISNTSSISPMDTWRLSSKDIVPTTGWQGAGGIYWTLFGGLDFSVEGYYKKSRNALDYKSGAMLSMNPDLAEELVPVQGRAYGVEVMLSKPAGSLTGWVSYTYSRSQLQEMQDRGAETINGGAWYNAPYDKPHEFKFAGNYAFTHRFSLSLNVDYSTGRPITIPIGKYFYDGEWRLAYSERNSYRIPDYFRIDAALNIDPGHYKKAFAHASFTIGVYNITGRKNPYSVFFKTLPSGQVKGYMLSVFASQVPYVNLNILF